MLNWAARNKYKLMAAIVAVYLLADGWQHKGLTRVLLPKSFAGIADTSYPGSRSVLACTNKEWVQAVNTIQRMNDIPATAAGIECDVYYNSRHNSFEVHHDPGNFTGLTLEALLQTHAKQKCKASLWLDFKNLSSANQQPALTELIRLRSKFGLTGKMLVESSEATLLSAFSDSGFFTSCYVPMFNPYLISISEERKLADSLGTVLRHSNVNAVSGYYFQHSFLHHYFPNYPILTWAVRDRFSLINWLFRKKILSDGSVFIILYP